MGNRAVITIMDQNEENNFNKENIGVYLHWNGGRDSVTAFLTYCKLKGYREPENDCYGWARLCQVIGNFFGGETSIGIDQCKNLDCDNWDNGVYLIKNWEIVGRVYHEGREQNSYKLLDMLLEINDKQPLSEQLDVETISKYVAEIQEGEW